MSIRTSFSVAGPLSRTCRLGECKGSPVSAWTSRAMPQRLKQSGRLGVTSKSMTTSSSPVATANGVPTGKSSSSTKMPSWLSPNPSSSSAQSMPSDATPRILAFLICRPPGSVVPGRATATACPAATLGAPQTMVLIPVPTSTWQTVKRSAFSCGLQALTRPMTTPS